jgi:ATP-dependent Clp protease ATP-binding subunit ClpC
VDFAENKFVFTTTPRLISISAGATAGAATAGPATPDLMA